MRNVDWGHRAQPQFYPSPVARSIETNAPANGNADVFDPTAADFMAGMIEADAWKAIRDLFALKGPEMAEKHVAKIIEDLGWR